MKWRPLTHRQDEARALSVECYGVDLETHWPRYAQKQAARNRERRIDAVAVRDWDRHMRAVWNLHKAFA